MSYGRALSLDNQMTPNIIQQVVIGFLRGKKTQSSKQFSNLIDV